MQHVDVFAFHPERFVAGRQDMRLWCLADDTFGQRCRNADHVLAIVEHEEDLPVANKGQQTNEWVLSLHRESQCRRNRRRHELRIGQRSQIDEEDRVMKSTNQSMGDRDCYCSFSDAARTDDADEAPRLYLPRQLSNSVVATDHSRWSWRQPLNSFRCGGPGDWNRSWGGRACRRSDETIPTT